MVVFTENRPGGSESEGKVSFPGRALRCRYDRRKAWTGMQSNPYIWLLAWLLVNTISVIARVRHPTGKLEKWIQAV